MSRGPFARRRDLRRAAGLAALALAGAGAGAAPASAASLPNPTITYVTVHKQPDGGEIRRATTTLIDVPTLLRVDAGPSPDLLATVVLLSTSRVTLIIDRLPGSNARLPASIEAVARDPTGGSLGRQRIAIGYDARSSSAPRRFRAVVLFGVGGDKNHLAVEQTVGGATDGLATIAELFDAGAGGARLRPQRIAIGFAPVPERLRVDAVLASPRIEVEVNTFKRRTVATIDGALDDGKDANSLHAVVDTLPDVVKVVYAQDDAGRPAVSYDANAEIGSIRARYERRSEGRLRTVVNAAIDKLPGSLRFALTGASSGAFAASAPIGQVEIAAADGEPLAVAGTAPGVRLERTKAGLTSFAARLRGLQSATLSSSPAFKLAAVIERQPFSVAVVDASREVSLRGSLELPARPTLTVDIAKRLIDYQGDDEPIRRIDLKARGRILAGLRLIKATIEDMPSGVVRFGVGHGKSTRFSFDGKQPIGVIDVVATGRKLPPRSRPGRDVIYFRDVRRNLAAHVRISGLHRVAVLLPSSKRKPIDLSIERVGGRPIDVDVRARVGKARSLAVVEGSLLRLPETMRLIIGRTDTTHVSYIAAKATGEIHLSARGRALPAALRRVRLDARGLPRTLRIDARRDLSLVKASAQPAIGYLSAAIAAHGRARPVAGSGSGLRIGGTSAYALRVRGLKSFVARPKNPLRLDATLKRQRFSVSADLREQGLRINGTIADLPRRLGLTVDLPNGVVAYNGHGERIGRIAVRATSRKPLLDRARRIGLTVLNFPSARVNFDAEAGNVRFDATEQLGTVDLTATDGNAKLPPHPAGRDLVYYHDVPGTFALHARVSGVRRAAFAPDPLTVELERGDRRPIDIDVRAGSSDPLVVAGHSDGLPSKVRFAMTAPGGGTRLQYDASQRLGAIHLSGGGGFLGTNARVDLIGLPRRVTADIKPDKTFSVRADAPIGSLAIATAETGAAKPLAGSGSGLRLVTDGPGEGLAARLRGITSGALLQASPLRFEGEIARQPFGVDVDSVESGLRVTGTIADLPQRVRLTFAPENGLIDYDGGGERVGRVDFDARSSKKALLLGGRHVFGHVLGLPSAKVLLTADNEGTPGFKLTAGQPVGLVDLTAANGNAPAPPAPGGGDLVHYHKVDGDRVFRVRATGVRGFALALPDDDRPITAKLERNSALPVDVDVKLALDKAKDPRPLSVIGRLDRVPSVLEFKLRTAGGVHASYAASGPVGSLRVEAKGAPLPKQLRRAVLDVRGAPARLAVGIPDGCQPQITVRGSGPVQRISLNARGAEPLFGGATRVRATAENVPDRLTIAPGKGGLDFTASRAIGRISLVATDSRADPRAFPDGADGVYYRDVPSRYAVRAQVTGLRRVAYAKDPIRVLVARPGGRVLRLDVLTRPVTRATNPAKPKADKEDGCAEPVAKRKQPGKGVKLPAALRLTGHLDGLPNQLRVTYDDRNGTVARYRATGPLRHLSLLARGLDLGAIKGHVQLDVQRVPKEMSLTVRDGLCVPGGEAICKVVVADADKPIGRLEARLSGGKFAKVTGKGNKLIAGVTTKLGLNLGARISNLKELRVVVGRTPTTIDLHTTGAARQPTLKTYVRLGRRERNAWNGVFQLALKNLPGNVHICVDRGPACVQSERLTATASAQFIATPAPDAPQLEITGIVRLKQVNEGCTGPESARLVTAINLERLDFMLRPVGEGLVYLSSVNTRIGGEFSYFSSERERLCVRFEKRARLPGGRYESSRRVGRVGRVVLDDEGLRINCRPRPNKDLLVSSRAAG